MFKYLLSVFALTALTAHENAAGASDQLDLITKHPAYQGCLSENNMESLESAVGKGVTEQLQCFFLCMAKGDKWIKEDGEVDPSRVDELLSGKVSEEVADKIKTCLNEVKVVKECGDVEKFHKCIRTN